MSGPLLAAVRELVAAAPWEPAEDAAAGTLTWAFAGEHGDYTATVWAREDRRQVVVHAASPAPVPPGRRAEVALLLAHLGFRTPFGGFELDATTGTWRVRAALDLGAAALDPALLEPLLLAAFTLADHWRPAVEDVCAGTPALEAYARGAAAARDLG